MRFRTLLKAPLSLSIWGLRFRLTFLPFYWLSLACMGCLVSVRLLCGSPIRSLRFVWCVSPDLALSLEGTTVVDVERLCATSAPSSGWLVLVRSGCVAFAAMRPYDC